MESCKGDPLPIFRANEKLVGGYPMPLEAETLDLVLNTLKDFANRSIPLEKRLALDAHEEFPHDIIEELLGPDVGLHLVFIPEEYGGLGGGAYDIYRVSEAMARVDLGIATAILDETIGRAIMIKYQDFWSVTIEFTTRYRKPIPLSEEIRVIGRITKNSRRYFEGTGEILLEDGSVAAEGRGKFFKLPLEKIADFDFDEQEWKVIPSPDDPEEVEI